MCPVRSLLRSNNKMSYFIQPFSPSCQVLTPVDYDQFLNADEAERLGIGVNLPWKKVTEATLTAALGRIV